MQSMFRQYVGVRSRNECEKVSRRDPGQNEYPWGPFLVHRKVSLPEFVGKLTFPYSKQIRILLVSFCIFVFIIRLLLFIIGFKNGLLRLGDGFQYDIWHFWKFPNSDKRLDFGALNYCRKTLKIQDKIPIHFKTYYFCQSEDLTSWKFWEMCAPRV